MKAHPLPDGFADLESLTGTWCIETMAQRSAKRLASTQQDLEALYSTLVGRMDAILSHLARFAADAPLPEGEHNLYLLACAFMEVSPAVELFRAPDVPDGFPAEKFQVLAG